MVAMVTVESEGPKFYTTASICCAKLYT